VFGGPERICRATSFKMSSKRLNLWVASMPNYRLYCLNDAGGISLAETIIASDDQDAINQARELKQDALKCEVWDGRRLVATLNGQDLSAQGLAFAMTSTGR
jgi:hypothetical protein